MAGSVAPPLRLLAPDREFDARWQDHFRHVNHTQLQNMAGYPSLSLPLFAGAGGLPAGAMLWPRHGGDDLLLVLGLALKQAHPWTYYRPILHTVITVKLLNNIAWKDHRIVSWR